MWRLNRLQGIQIRSTRRPRSMQNVMYNTYITSLGSTQTQRRREQSVKAKNATTKRVNYATNNKLLYGNAEAKQEDRAKPRQRWKERERKTPSPSLLMHATLISLENERWLNFRPLRQIEYACDTFFGGKALKAHYVYAMCCISKRNTPTFLSFSEPFSMSHNFACPKTCSRFLSSKVFSPSHFFRIFFSITSFALCAFVCVCLLLPFVLSVLLAVRLSLLEFPFRLLAVFSCFHLISFASPLCLFLFCWAPSHHATKGIF